MTVLALRMASYSNGVSKLHGEVSRKMWQSSGRRCREDEVPISHVTNGVHVRSWISHDMNQLYDRYLGPAVAGGAGRSGLWQRTESIPAEELWRTHERRRERLVAFARRRLRDATGAPRRAARRDRSRRGSARSRRADHRLRPPLRHLQTRHPAAAGPGAARAHPEQPRTPRPVHLRRQGPPARRRRQRPDPPDPGACPPEGIPPPRGLPGGLRHGREPRTWCRAPTSG